MGLLHPGARGAGRDGRRAPGPGGTEPGEPEDLVYSVAGQAEALPLPDASIDCVLANGILNLSPDKSAVLREIARVLKPGGRLVLAETTLRHPPPPERVRDLEAWFT